MKDTSKLLTRGGIEVVAIIVGISLSFWAENTRKHNGILEEEKVALERISDDMVQDTLQLVGVLESYEYRIDLFKRGI
ncbi:MAG: hypothetical protein U9N31_07375 [Candidatus Marinimicrobia bacterium]|nr:hypothetical protein [Candidatus Neomarinimicrobiota bacterium]